MERDKDKKWRRGNKKRIGKRHEWKGKETKENYYTKQGTLIALPRYYKYKLFTEEQREQLWIYREESGEKYVGNFKIEVKDEESEEYYNTLKKEHNTEGAKYYKYKLFTEEQREQLWIYRVYIVTGKQIGRAHV